MKGYIYFFDEVMALSTYLNIRNIVTITKRELLRTLVVGRQKHNQPYTEYRITDILGNKYRIELDGENPLERIIEEADKEANNMGWKS